MLEVKTRVELLSEMNIRLAELSDMDLVRYADCILPGWHRLVGGGAYERTTPRLDEDLGGDDNAPDNNNNSLQI